MKPQYRMLALALMIAAALLFNPPPCTAELLPPGDFQGKSQSELGLAWVQWAVKTTLGEQSLPDTVDGIRYLPPNLGGGDFSADVTIQPGTPLLGSPFFVVGERYDDASEDNPADPFIDTIFEGTTMRTTLDGNVVLEGSGSDLSERRFAVTVFAQAIPYADPQPRGDINAVAAIFGTGIVTIFDNLAVGEHTIKNEFDSSVFGAASFTYNITVVPEPASLAIAGIGGLALVWFVRPLRSRRKWN